MKNYILLTLLFACTMLKSQVVFRHVTTAANISGHITTLDHPQLNGNPNAIIFIMPNYNIGGAAAAGVDYVENAGVWYNGTRWTIFNQNTSKPMPQSATFNVLIAPANNPNYFTVASTTQNIEGIANGFFIDHPATNNKPNALLLVTQNWSSIYNDDAPITYYSKGKWHIGNTRYMEYWNDNTKIRFLMKKGSRFNVMVIENGQVPGFSNATAFLHTANTANIIPAGTHITFLDNRAINGNTNAVIFATPYWGHGDADRINPLFAGGPYNSSAIKAWYDHPNDSWNYKNGYWSIYNSSGGINMPVGAKFHVVVVNSTNTPADTRVMTRFNPTVHGFKFSNTFDNNGFVAGIRLNFSGLCGGMSYSALDYFFRNTPIPQTDVKPNEGTQLTEYIRSRQWKTFENQADKWAELVFNPGNPFDGGRGIRNGEFFNWGVQGFNGGRLQELRSQLDNGKPAILGLFAAGSGGFSSEHHQVIAIGYDMGRYRGDLGANKDDLKIFICDPNYPNQIMVLKPSESRQRYYYELTDINKTTLKPGKIEEIQKREWLTYFVDLNYVTTTPLDPNIINRCSNVNFENQNMSGQTHNRKAYRCAKATGVNFRGATISGTDFGNSTFRSAIFYGANCNNTNFAQSNLDNADFYGADLRNCNFSNTDLKSVRFYGADLKVVTMLSANAQDANFEGADLHQGKFNRTSFRNARLFKTSFNTTDCRNADFSGANLTGADFRNANISEANFTGAITTGIQLQGAIREGTIGL